LAYQPPQHSKSNQSNRRRTSCSSATNDIVLRIADRRHPTLEGTYLAACTFYAALFGESPVGQPYTAGLDGTIARTLQLAAWDTVTAYYGWD
jgi:hypothetical protein